MAFLEGPRGNVLFTGDFRLPLGSASRLMFFKHKNTSSESSFNNKSITKDKKAEGSTQDQVKSVDYLYIDMTFFKPEIQYIPTREESVRSLIKFINEVLSANDTKIKISNKEYFKNYIYLKTSARIGYEFAYKEINARTNFKIHVNELIYRIYDQLPDIQSALTLDPFETPIHACVFENKKRVMARGDLMPSLTKSLSEKSPNNDIPLLPCQLDLENIKAKDKKLNINFIKVILSAMWFTDTAGVDKIFLRYKPSLKEMETPAFKPYDSIYRLCYSFHSSFEEIVDFLDTLRPKNIHAIALPESTSEKMIDEYFYDSKKNFIGFHNRASNSSVQAVNKNASFLNESKKMNKLVLRKRKSFEHKSNSDTSNDSSNSTDDELNFDEDDDEISSKNKLKKAKTFSN